MARCAWLLLVLSWSAAANGGLALSFAENRVVAPWNVRADPAPFVERLADWRRALDEAALNVTDAQRAALDAENARHALTCEWVDVQKSSQAAWRELDAAALTKAQALLRRFWVAVERYDERYPTRPSLLDASSSALHGADHDLKTLATFRPQLEKRLAGLARADVLAGELEAALDAPQSDANTLSRRVERLREHCAELDAHPWPTAALLLAGPNRLPAELSSRIEGRVACLNAAPTKVEGAVRWYEAEVRARRSSARP